MNDTCDIMITSIQGWGVVIVFDNGGGLPSSTGVWELAGIEAL